MPKRVAKQLLYGLLYLGVFTAVIGSFYFFGVKKPASCFDNVKNQDETDVDCGGASCIPCALKHAQPLQSDTVLALPINGQTTLVARVSNPNAEYGADSFDFHFALYDRQGKVRVNFYGKSFIYPHSFSYLIEPALVLSVTPSEIDHVTLDITNPDWKTSAEFPKPDLMVREQSQRGVAQEVIASGVLFNNSTLKVPVVMMQALFKNTQGIVIGASQTILKDVLPSENRRFEIHHPNLPDLDLGLTEILPAKAAF